MNKRLSLEIRRRQRDLPMNSPGTSKFARQTTISFPSLFDSPASNIEREAERERHRKAMGSPRRSSDD